MARRAQSGAESPFREAFYVQADQVVREALEGVACNRPRVYPGLKIAAAALVLGLIPLGLLRVALATRPRR